MVRFLGLSSKNWLAVFHAINSSSASLFSVRVASARQDIIYKRVLVIVDFIGTNSEMKILDISKIESAI